LKLKKISKVGVTTVLIFFFAISILSNPAYAITGNYLEDEGRHPYVCLVVFYDAAGEPLWRTTGSLLSSTVVLTAGHGTDGATSASIWIEEGPIAYNPPNHYPYGHNDESYDGTPITMPGFGYYVDSKGLVGFITNDVGIVVLSEAVPKEVVNAYGQLPSVGVVDTLKVGTDVTFVGYGVQYQVTPKNNGGPYGAWTGLRERFYATANLLSNKFAFSSTFIKCSANAAQGKGGTAFGDSGGPVLLGGTNTILATTSFGANSNCAGTGYYYRIDQPEVLEWINGFL
jgi:secreted trypsin-like serine protease